MNAARPMSLPFRIGTHTIGSVSRRLVRLGWSLDQARAGAGVTLPPLADADGYLLTSMPEDQPLDSGPMIVVHRQSYRRYFIDLTMGRAAWLAQLSGSTRSAMRRKARRLAAASGGSIDVTAYRTAGDIAAFHGPARLLSAATYQEKRLGAGLPRDPADLLALAASDDVRAWMLRIEGRPAAYLCCTADADTLRYDHVGHDPAFAALSPGAVLQMAALDTLFADRFTRFDFTEGEGQHKRTFASGSVACTDLLLLRPTLGNRALALALSGFDAGIAVVKRLARHPIVAGAVRRAWRAV